MRILNRLLTMVLLTLSTTLPATAQQPSGGKLPTRWDKDVSATSPLPDYPRPQMMRKAWMSLNGSWEYALTDKAAAEAPTTFEGRILVPYPMESALSGVHKASVPDQRLWYRLTFTVPAAWPETDVPTPLSSVLLRVAVRQKEC